MTTCSVCGEPNDDARSACSACGTALRVGVGADEGGMAIVPDEPSTAPTATKGATVTFKGHGAPGEVIAGRYELQEILGRGGVGVVYRARDRELNEMLALKLLAGPSSSDPVEVERFKREIVTARRITHPNVIRIHDFGMSGAEAFISMELLSGGTLADLIEKQSPVPLKRAAEIAIGVCEGLEAAHAQGIVHRDLKPDNVLFDGGGNPKLVDFGLARLATSTTKTVGFSGTPFYMSPEQADGSDVTARSDLYSLGVVLYELFTGKLPFVADSLVRIALLHANETPPQPRSVRPDLPAELEALLMRALQKDPARRFSRASEIAEDLRLWRDGRALKHTVVTEVSIARPPAREETAAVRPTRQPTLKGSRRDVQISESPAMVPMARSRQEATVIVSNPPPVAPGDPSEARTAASRGGAALPPRRTSIHDAPMAAVASRAAPEAVFELPPEAPRKSPRGAVLLVGGIFAAGVFAAGLYGAAQLFGAATTVATPREGPMATPLAEKTSGLEPIATLAKATPAEAKATPATVADARATPIPKGTARVRTTPIPVRPAPTEAPPEIVYGKISIGSRPSADVYIDGKKLAPNGKPYGTTPTDVEAPVGDHVLTLRRGSDVLYEARIDIRPRGNSPLSLKRDPRNEKRLVPDVGGSR